MEFLFPHYNNSFSLNINILLHFFCRDFFNLLAPFLNTLFFFSRKSSFVHSLFLLLLLRSFLVFRNRRNRFDLGIKLSLFFFLSALSQDFTNLSLKLHQVRKLRRY
uniref:(northern house mosquito) hypothetical protein n=1 Tax=Culex pipiens TaxID=7175 RepID=A0A8D8FPF5_CULPI